ncbi:2-iminobutanoate/2-iminopropanoate deaminase-like isoform X2 [Daktulosphaira vitifoliae]|uniref:2-iminobutanoate/2-iminopropanoate deaminase-like isoform X2 n=1 Tax=Daktulosphaira vitifoliae TaxID=58002 RepID=UPI0021A9B93E|nr:2-iminobutanoate/2-iminopropanoate deaminase-like isoform X2 [Daktulosphaira vitifoliae]
MPTINKMIIVEPKQNGNLKSNAVVAYNIVYTSAIYGKNRINGKFPEQFIDEVHLAFKNLSYTLETAGASCESVIKVVIYIKTYSVARMINDVFSKYFSIPYCARLQMQVDQLPEYHFF